MPKLSSFLEDTRPVTLADGSSGCGGRISSPTCNATCCWRQIPGPMLTGCICIRASRSCVLIRATSRLAKTHRRGKHRVQHPTRPDAYQPVVKSNGAGAFVIEGEQPHIWDDRYLDGAARAVGGRFGRRFGDIRTVSRRTPTRFGACMSTMSAPFPLLSDTVTRFQIDRDIKTFIEQYRQCQPASNICKPIPPFSFNCWMACGRAGRLN